MNTKIDERFVDNAMASFVRIGALLVLLIWCYDIVAPFVQIVAWAMIIAVAIYPAHQSLAARLGKGDKLPAVLLAFAGIAIIVVPAWLLADSTITSLRELAAHLEEGSIAIPAPRDEVAGWPVIGPRVYEIWSNAASNLEATLNQFAPQLRSLGQSALAFAGSAVLTVLQFVLSIIIAAALLPSAGGGYRLTRSIATNLIGKERGAALADLSIKTIRSVFKGVLGVAFIQSILAAVGLVVMGVPAAGLWAGAVLVLAIVQLPPLLVLGPIAVWVFSVAEPLPATVFAVYAFIVSISDSFLKPMLLGRGVDVPMLVILIGAIGGALSAGIIGLFVGAVVLALGYEILTAWVAAGAGEPVADRGSESA